MARIPILDENDPALPPETRTCLQELGKTRGKILNVYRAMANRPAAAYAFSNIANTVYRTNSTLKPTHGELAYLTATAVNNCYY